VCTRPNNTFLQGFSWVFFFVAKPFLVLSIYCVCSDKLDFYGVVRFSLIKPLVGRVAIIY